jgi:hypothetical protein
MAAEGLEVRDSHQVAERWIFEAEAVRNSLGTCRMPFDVLYFIVYV